MDNLIMEIDRFITNSKVAVSTKRSYRKYLMEFIYYQSSISESKIEDLHLEKFYKVYSKSGAFLCYKPIDVCLFDKYYQLHIEEGHNWLRASTNSLSSFFKYLNRRYDFPNLIKEVKKNYSNQHRKDKRPQRILSRHEILYFFQSLIKSSKDIKRDVLLFALLFSTGSRISEILNLKVSDVNWSEDVLILKETKNKVQRIVVLREHFAFNIKEYVSERRLCKDDFLFCSPNNKKQMRRSEVQNLLSEYLKLSGVERINIHGTRHTFATLMYENGSELLVIQQLLGHRSLQSTRTYVHSELR